MKWDENDVAYLRTLRDDISNDNIKLKQQIKKKLLEDRYIIHVLNNKELEENDAEPGDYFGVNILPYYMLLDDTQTNVKNYICFETCVNYTYRYQAGVMKSQLIVFHILCDIKNLIDKDTSLARHDLLAALITGMFNYGRFLGGRFKLVADVPEPVDRYYCSRTLTFRQDTDNNLVKMVDGKPRIVNKDYTGATQI